MCRSMLLLWPFFLQCSRVVIAQENLSKGFLAAAADAPSSEVRLLRNCDGDAWAVCCGTNTTCNCDLPPSIPLGAPSDNCEAVRWEACCDAPSRCDCSQSPDSVPAVTSNQAGLVTCGLCKQMVGMLQNSHSELLCASTCDTVTSVEPFVTMAPLCASICSTIQGPDCKGLDDSQCADKTCKLARMC
eukprot:TRINITY_DN19908_c0_g1_i2.p1 TRINITY_DN19908_c0_g1~~TRINITY_DN19908_c0_g1_i2.p1  ORF type:complete len:187 (+),score=11.87 TRINITY_DN19908_c0_g1_i2:87-647(+)